MHLTDLFFNSVTLIQDEIIYVLVICAFINVCLLFLIKQGYFGLKNPFFCHLDTQIGLNKKKKKILTAYSEDSLKNFLKLMF